MRSILPLRRPEWSRMATPYAAPLVVADAPQPPRLSVLRAVAAAGLATAGCALGLALANDDVSGLQIALLEWISIPYIAAGLIAWWRRPDSRLGRADDRRRLRDRRCPRWRSPSYAVPHTIGAGLRPPARRPLPARVPRVSRRPPAVALRAVARRRPRTSAAIGLQLVKMALGGVGAEQPAGGLAPAGRRADRGAASSWSR